MTRKARHGASYRVFEACHILSPVRRVTVRPPLGMILACPPVSHGPPACVTGPPSAVRRVGARVTGPPAAPPVSPVRRVMSPVRRPNHKDVGPPLLCHVT